MTDPQEPPIVDVVTPRPRPRIFNAPRFLLERLSGVYRHRTRAALIFLFVVALVMVRSFLTTPQYQVRARIEMDPLWAMMMAGPNAGNMAIGRDPARYYRTQMFILRDPPLAATTLRELDLSAVPEYGGDSPTDAGPRERFRETLRNLSDTLFGWMERLAPPVSPGASDPALLAEEAETRARAEHFARRVLVERVGETQMIDVTFSAADPVFAAEAVNAHVERYVRFILERHVADSGRSLEWLDAELEKQRQLLETSQRALVEYRVENDALSLDADSNLAAARLRALNERVVFAEQARLRRESVYEQVRDLDPESPATTAYPAVAGDADVQEALRRQTALDAERTTLSGRYGERHPTMIKLNASIAAATAAVHQATARAIDTIRNQYQAARDDEQSVSREFERQQAGALELGRQNIGYDALQREADANQRVYESLLEQQKQLMVSSGIRTSNVKIVDRAEVPGAPFSPNTRRDLFMAIVAGLLFSAGFVSVIEYLDDTIKTPDDVTTRRLDLPVLALVPAVGHEHRLTPGAPVPPAFGEAFRQLRTAVVFQPADGASTRLIAVTSTQPFEGKTTCACHLATVLALGGKRVLLMDADMRRPGVHRAFALSNTNGLSRVLAGETRIRSAVQRTHDPNLHVLPAGPTPSDPLELLSSRRLSGFLQMLKVGPFDWIIVDAPPILGGSDTRVIARSVPTLLLVVGSGMTRAAHTTRALEMLPADAGAAIVGVVLNRVGLTRDRYHYSRYYGSHAARYHTETPAA